MRYPEFEEEAAPILFVCPGSDGSGRPFGWARTYRQYIIGNAHAEKPEGVSRKRGAWTWPCPHWPLSLARRVKENFPGRPLVLIGFSRGAWWGFEWFTTVEPGLFDRFLSVAGYPLSKYNAEGDTQRSHAADLRRHVNPCVWITSTADNLCQVDAGYSTFYQHLRQEGDDDTQPSSCKVVVSRTLSHTGLRSQFIEECPSFIVDFVNTGNTEEIPAS